MAADLGVLRSFVRDIADYPTEGVTFRDITPLLGDAAALAATVNGLVDAFAGTREHHGHHVGHAAVRAVAEDRGTASLTGRLDPIQIGLALFAAGDPRGGPESTVTVEPAARPRFRSRGRRSR